MQVSLSISLSSLIRHQSTAVPGHDPPLVAQPRAVADVPLTGTARPARCPSFLSLSLPLLSSPPFSSDSDKKSHQGWGGDQGNAELKAQQAAANDAAIDAVQDPSPDAPNSAPHPPPDPPLPKERDAEEDDNTLTLDQYLAQQKDKDIALPKLQPSRPANEGADQSIWKDAVPLSKDEDALSYFVGKVLLPSPFFPFLPLIQTGKVCPKGPSQKR